MQSFRIALRNTARQRKRTVFLAGAMGFGVLVITLFGSFVNGAQINVRENMTGVLGGHVYIQGEVISDTGRILPRIEDGAALSEVVADFGDRVADIRLRSHGRGELIFGSRRRCGSVEGVDWNVETELWNSIGIIQGDRKGLETPGAVVLPLSIVEGLGVEVGESVLFRISTITGQMNVGEFIIVGICHDQESFGLEYSYVDRAYLNSLIGLGADDSQTMNLTLSSMVGLDEFVMELLLKLDLACLASEPRESGSGGRGHVETLLKRIGITGPQAAGETGWEGTRFSVTSLNDVLDPLLSLLDTLEYIRIGLFWFLMIIILVGLLNSFRMILIERMAEIGTMRALGMQRSGVRNIMLLEALLLAVLGALSGGILALLANTGLGHLRIGDDTALRIFMDNGRFSFPYVLGDVLATALYLSLSTLIAAWLPARQAARLRPSDALRAVL